MRTVNRMRDKIVKGVLHDVKSSIDALAAKQILEAQPGGGVKFVNDDLNPVAFAMPRPVWWAHIQFLLIK